jgi:hypothetical protein
MARPNEGGKLHRKVVRVGGDADNRRCLAVRRSLKHRLLRLRQAQRLHKLPDGSGAGPLLEAALEVADSAPAQLSLLSQLFLAQASSRPVLLQ